MMEVSYRFLSVCAELVVLLCSTIKANEYMDGHWSAWGSMSPCSVTCGLGTMSIERVWIQGSDELPSEVPFTSTQVFPCTNTAYPDCPQDGEWSGWTLWSNCNNACGGGLRQRERICSGNYFGGKPCEGENIDNEDCNRQPCPPLPKHFDLSQCKANFNFTCTSQKMCIPLIQKCDKIVQCNDGSDEETCLYQDLQAEGNIRYSISMWRNDAVSTYSSAIVTLTLMSAFFIIILFN